MNELYFYEYELKTDELFGEFYLKIEDKKNTVLVLLTDRETKAVKEYTVVEHFYDEDDNFCDSVYITKEYSDLDISYFVDKLFNKTKDADFNKNFCLF